MPAPTRRVAAQPPATPPTPAARPPARAPRRTTVLAPPPARTPGLLAWMRVHKVAPAGLCAMLVIAVSAAAVLAILQSVATTATAKAPLVVFQDGADYAAINAAGFATVGLGSSGASATLALSGVPGAASVTLGNVLKLNNRDAGQPQAVTLSRSAAPHSAITQFLVTVKSGGTTLLTWDAATAAASGPFTLPAATVVDISVTLVIADGTAVGTLGTFALDFTMAPA